MNSDFDRNNGIRSQMRAKRRKTNLVLNGLIGLVLLLIIFVSVIIFGDDDPKKEVTEQTGTKTNISTGDENVAKQDVKTPTKKEKSKNEDDEDEAAKEDVKDNKDSDVVTAGGGDSNVKNTITNPDWKPVGTSQSGPFSSSDVDWDERVKALAYAIGTDSANMTVWYLGRDGGDRSIGTVSAKGSPETYRVYLEWKDGGGWMPTKVEELVANDKR